MILDSKKLIGFILNTMKERNPFIQQGCIKLFKKITAKTLILLEKNYI